MVGIVRVEALRHHLRGDFEDLVTQCLLKSLEESLEVLLVDPPRPDERIEFGRDRGYERWAQTTLATWLAVASARR